MGSSSSSSASKTQNQDNRTVASQHAIAIVGSSGNNNLNITDGGLVKQGLAYLTQADQANTDRLGLLLQGANNVMQANQQTVQGAQALTGQILAADATNKGNVSQSTMIMLALVGVGAVILMRKG